MCVYGVGVRFQPYPEPGDPSLVSSKLSRGGYWLSIANVSRGQTVVTYTHGGTEENILHFRVDEPHTFRGDGFVTKNTW